MNFNFKCADGTTNWLHSEKENIFQRIYGNYPNNQSEIYDLAEDFERREVVQNGTKWTYLSGFPNGLRCALFSIAARVTAVVEPIIKGVLNIICAPFSEKFNATTGLKMLGISLPLSLFKLVFLTPVEVLGEVFVTPLAVMLDKQYSQARSEFEHHMIKGQEVDDEPFQMNFSDEYPTDHRLPVRRASNEWISE